MNRADYMDGKCTHQEYYIQFECAAMRDCILARYSVEDLKTALAEDRHLNNTPMIFWDYFAGVFKPYIFTMNEKINGRRVWSNCDGVCIGKAIACKLVEEQNVEA